MSLDALTSVVAHWGYAIVFAALLLDHAGLPVPGALVLVSFGAFARRGDVDPLSGLLVASLATVVGNSAAYWLGRLGDEHGRHLYCRMTLGSRRGVRKVIAASYRYGDGAPIVAPFIVGSRAFLPALAGAAGAPFGRFLLVDAVGAALWSALFLVVGYAFGWRLQGGIDDLRRGAAVLFGVVTLSAAAYLTAALASRRRHGGATLGERHIARVARSLGLRGQRPYRAPRGARAVVEPLTSDGRAQGHAEPAFPAELAASARFEGSR